MLSGANTDAVCRFFNGVGCQRYYWTAPEYENEDENENEDE
jgi:hypothetical protein